MIFKKTELGGDAYLDAYIADKIDGFTRDAILVIPGGGYGSICSEREGEPIAQAFIPYGFNAFVLHYSVGEGKHFPLQLTEASLAMKHIKDNADEYNINPERVFAAGFSAGGHLAASLGILWDNKEVNEKIDMPFGYNRPTGIMPIYPVVSSDRSFTHIWSIENLLGKENMTEENMLAVSLEKHVNENSSPAFIVHTSNDEAVNVKNSLALAGAYANAGMKLELHIYPDAPHGVALGNEITECGCKKWNNPCIAKWVENAALWAKGI